MIIPTQSPYRRLVCVCVCVFFSLLDLAIVGLHGCARHGSMDLREPSGARAGAAKCSLGRLEHFDDASRDDGAKPQVQRRHWPPHEPGQATAPSSKEPANYSSRCNRSPWRQESALSIKGQKKMGSFFLPFMFLDQRNIGLSTHSAMFCRD